MAVMINLAQDWTFDMFVEDANLYKATAQKGVHCRSNAEYREYFMVTLKNQVRDFLANWNKDHDGHLYDRYDGWAGDAFAKELRRSEFSDFYKEAYGQRPHLGMWFYVHVLGLPHSEDVGRTFCATPVEDATNMAKRVRDYFEEED